MNLNIGNKGEKIEIRNFLGEKRTAPASWLRVSRSRGRRRQGWPRPRGQRHRPRLQVRRAHPMSCLVKKKDIRKFLDGFYVSEKGVISMSKRLLVSEVLECLGEGRLGLGRGKTKAGMPSFFIRLRSFVIISCPKLTVARENTSNTTQLTFRGALEISTVRIVF